MNVSPSEFPRFWENWLLTLDLPLVVCAPMSGWLNLLRVVSVAVAG